VPEPEAAAIDVARLVTSAMMAEMRIVAAIVWIDGSGKECQKNCGAMGIA